MYFGTRFILCKPGA